STTATVLANTDATGVASLQPILGQRHCRELALAGSTTATVLANTDATGVASLQPILGQRHCSELALARSTHAPCVIFSTLPL
ncbi:hypothetical protein, partial [Lentimonas sp. CC11]|uniref:hypothetical protein n=1 Tax=Lentimonas sp. CC11 TaxID=2676096 RepID=UPI001A7E69F4